MDFYSEMMSRNWAFISPEEQEKIKKTKIFLAGCGLGSNIALLAVQTGFTRFILADHDVVEVSNLNRQAFDRRHIGVNKALALKSILEEKSEVVEVEAYPVRVTPENAEKFISKADVVVNTVDFDETVYVVNEIAREQGKPVFFPLNIGWGHGFCLVFTPESVTLEEMVGGRNAREDEFFMNLLQSIQDYSLPEYMVANFEKIMEGRKEKGYNPQLGMGAFCTSIVVVDSIIRTLFKTPLKVAPKAMSIQDTFKILRTKMEVKKNV